MEVDLGLCSIKKDQTEVTKLIADLVSEIGGWHSLVFDYSICFIDVNNRNNEMMIRISETVPSIIWISGTADEFMHYFIDNLIYFRKNDNHQAYCILKIAKSVGVSSDGMRTLYAQLGWGGTEKGEKYLKCIDSSSDILQKMIFDNKIALQTVYQLSIAFSSDEYDRLLSVVSGCTFSEINKNIGYIIEAAKTSADVHQLIAHIADETSDMTPKQISEYIYRLRYPKRQHYEAVFDKFLADIKLKNRVIAPFLLEKQSYNLNLQFRDAADLVRQIDGIRQKLAGVSPDDDKFILDNIFCEDRGCL